MKAASFLNLLGGAGGVGSKLAQGQTSSKDLLQGFGQGAALTAAPMGAYALGGPAVLASMAPSMGTAAMQASQPEMMYTQPGQVPQLQAAGSDPFALFAQLMQKSKGGMT